MEGTVVTASKWWALAALSSLQLADLGTTWVGIHLPGLREIDGLSFGYLVAVKLGVTSLILLATWGRTHLLTTAAIVLAAFYVPIVGSNVVLILRAGGAL
jgi:hypothetical protein